MQTTTIYEVLFSNENNKKINKHVSITKTDLFICLKEMLKDGYTKFEITIKEVV